MKATLKVILICIVAGYFSNYSFGQDTTTINFYSRIETYNLAKVLMADSIAGGVDDNLEETFKRDEMLGFIGDGYQRFYIHLISMLKEAANPYGYIVSGKSRVKDKICSFKGTVIIKQARLYKEWDCAECKQGFADCDMMLYEDKKQESSGVIKGKLKCKFLIDKKYGLRYDAVNLVSDGFAKNQFVGTWTSYKANTSKKCNWGDYRIPDCGDLDIGAGQFIVNPDFAIGPYYNSQLLQIQPFA
jgi:hypothetical protein